MLLGIFLLKNIGEVELIIDCELIGVVELDVEKRYLNILRQS